MISEIKHEYLGGVVHAMAGGKIRHRAASGNLLGLGSQLRGKSCRPFNSDTKVRVDLGEKRDAYLAVASLRILMIIDPARPWVQLDRQGENGGFLQEFYQSLEDVIPLPEIECELRLAEIYEGIELK
ncbi:MAG: hypothetical protein ACJAVK_003258 [Akkermansiaceae bacterium]